MIFNMEKCRDDWRSRVKYMTKDIKVLNFGSLNIDNVYSVPHFVQAKETLASTE